MPDNLLCQDEFKMIKLPHHHSSGFWLRLLVGQADGHGGPTMAASCVRSFARSVRAFRVPVDKLPGDSRRAGVDRTPAELLVPVAPFVFL